MKFEDYKLMDKTQKEYFDLHYGDKDYNRDIKVAALLLLGGWILSTSIIKVIGILAIINPAYELKDIIIKSIDYVAIFALYPLVAFSVSRTYSVIMARRFIKKHVRK